MLNTHAIDAVFKNRDLRQRIFHLKRQQLMAEECHFHKELEPEQTASSIEGLVECFCGNKICTTCVVYQSTDCDECGETMCHHCICNQECSKCDRMACKICSTTIWCTHCHQQVCKDCGYNFCETCFKWVCHDCGDITWQFEKAPYSTCTFCTDD